MKKTDDPLSAYAEKRDFSISPEPRVDLAMENSPLAFVVHKHLARRAHYDLRLEMQGVLKSWAVPKGPSLDPTQKRLAVPVEDHPLAYAGFEGEIPPKQYGAGKVIIWDRGNWEPLGDPQAGLSAGNLKFRLNGEKLQGSWALVRMKKKSKDNEYSWLLVKERDAFARPETDYDVLSSWQDSAAAGKNIFSLPTGAKPSPLPYVLSPQLASLVDKVPANADWIYEIKFDGYRLLARIDGPEVKLFTRNGQDWTSKLKNLLPPIGALNIESGWLDGELIIIGENGLPDFAALQAAFDSSRMEAIRYYVFDLPFYAGSDLRDSKLEDRRLLLAQIIGQSATEQISFSEDFLAPGQNIYDSACQLGLEGIIGKKKDSAYVSGRTRSWIKLKCTKRQEFVLAGYTESKAKKEGLKALLLGVFDESGRLRYTGRVGTGFDNLTEAKLKQRMDSLSLDHSPLYDPPTIEARWVRPELAAEISFSGWTKDGKVRHPVFRGLRDDKPTKDIHRETAISLKVQKPDGLQPPPYQSEPAPAEYLGLTISNPAKVIDPSTGLRKADLADYYQRAARWLLPQLDNRPVSFLRAPAGIKGQMFFQKHVETLKIQGLKVLDISCDPGHPALLEIDSPAALIGAVQMNVIEFHTWNASITNCEKPDRMVFDLDPGENTTWSMMLEAAELTRILLEELGLICFLKTSGGAGLHIVVPLTPRDGWIKVKDFSKAAAQHLARVIPSMFTALSGPKNRLGKIFIDYNRNSRGATTVAAYSARARSGLGVSMPCAWRELASITGGAQWTIANSHLRLESSQDPWADYPGTKQFLSTASKKRLLEL